MPFLNENGVTTLVVKLKSIFARKTEIPKATDMVPYSSSSTGSTGTSLEYARADHRHPESERNTSGVATYVSNAQFADANGIRYEIRGNVLFITINLSRNSGAAATSDFIEIAKIPYRIDNNGLNNAFYSGCFGNTATQYQLRFRPSGGYTHIDFAASNTTAGFVRGIFSFALL